MGAGLNSNQSSRAGSHDWITPRWILDALGPFDLDPCASATQPWPTAARSIQPPVNGLSIHWEARDLVWLNPPYGRFAAEWIERLASHPAGGIALLMARLDTIWQQRLVARSSACVIIRRRVRFARPDGTTPSRGDAGGASLLMAFGPVAKARLERAWGSGRIPGLLLAPGSTNEPWLEADQLDIVGGVA